MAGMDIDKIATILVIVGAINVGLVAIVGMDLVATVVSMIPVPMIDKIVYGAIGIAGLLVAKKTFM